MLAEVLPGVVGLVALGHEAGSGAPESTLDDILRYFLGPPTDERRSRWKFQSTGSGIVIDVKAGHILTTYHLVLAADEIIVLLPDGQPAAAEQIGIDPYTDLALLRVDASGLTALPLGDSDELRIGDFVVSVGNPFGLSQTVTMGIVSGLGRTGFKKGTYEDFIQTDASINPGSSGGPLVNLKGEVVGINSAIMTPAGGSVGIGFAIPINVARTVITDLAAYGRFRRGELGLEVDDVAVGDVLLGKVTSTAVVVQHVLKGSMAERAGVLTGDIIAELNGEVITRAADLRNRIALLRVGADVRLKLIRRGEAHELTLVLAEGPQRSVVFR
jgi:serine protease Do/serine protease DegQ